jgi:hypothetical protein
MPIENDISLLELIEIEGMSIRSSNICRSLGLDSLSKLISYYQKTETFLKIRNCGLKTEIELIKICKKYIGINKASIADNTIEEYNPRTSIQIPTFELQLKHETAEKIEKFTPFKRSVLNHHIEYQLLQLNVRARNGIFNLFQKKPSPTEIVDKIYSLGFNFNQIKSIGEKSALELIRFRQNISSFVNNLENIKESQLSRKYTKAILKTSFPLLPKSFFEQFFEESFYENGKIKLFKLIQNLIESDQLFNENQKALFINNFTITNFQTSEQIAQSLDITKERVRQIKVKLEELIVSKLQFILNLREEDLPKYSVEFNKAQIVVNPEFAIKINSTEETNFNFQFITCILGIVLNQTHSIFGDDEMLTFKSKVTNSRKLCSCYLIRNDLYNNFKFADFIDEINAILNMKISEDYLLYFEGFLSQFMENKSIMALPELIEVCEVILFNEFELVVNSEGYLRFESNSKKQVAKYIYEVLEELNELSKVETIFKELQKKYPYRKFSEQSVRASLQRDKHQFIFIGRSSTYGLKKWQNERENLKGGTIRDIVEEYLSNEDEPKHISEITQYVLKYRDTTETNVRTNIDLENYRFQFFSGYFIGLKGKAYKNVHKFKRPSGSHFRLSVFENMNGWHIDKVINYFVANYNYLPIQVKSLIDKKVLSGDLTISQENNLII